MWRMTIQHISKGLKIRRRVTMIFSKESRSRVQRSQGSRRLERPTHQRLGRPRRLPPLPNQPFSASVLVITEAIEQSITWTAGAKRKCRTKSRGTKAHKASSCLQVTD